MPNVSADLIYTGALNDTNEALYLFNENCELEDEIEALPDWPGGQKGERRSMERQDSLGWQTYQGIGQDGIFGTPKRENSPPPTVPAGGGGSNPPPEPTFCSQENLSESLHYPVILNEIAWMGTSQDWRNEWFELKNISENEGSLNGWQILDKDGEIKINLAGTVPANGFYLLERTDDNSIPDISADKIYTGNLEDNNESLRLFDQNCTLIDEVLASPDWPAGQKEKRRSMERKTDLGWQTYFGEGEEGIMGTPKKENSQKPEEKDEIPPSVSFTLISPLQINLSFTISWEITDVASPATPDITSGLAGFIFRWKEEEGDWQEEPYQQIEGAPLTFFGERLIFGEDGKIYYFQIKAKDVAENESEWVEIMVEINTLPVVINEIAWMGTGSSPTLRSDEWIELYNNTNQSLNLNGWVLKAIDGTPEINLARTVPANGFYLLERTDDNTLPDITADQIYTGALGNQGEKLELYNLDNHLIDRVICKEDEIGNCKEWPAGDNDTKQTMERKNPRLSGDNFDNWATSQNPGGTPKAQNSQYAP